MPVLNRSARAASLGCLLGCAAGWASALSDYGAHWLWLDGWRDRTWLALCLAGLEISSGAMIGCAIGVVLSLSERGVEWLGPRTLRAATSPERRLELLRALRLALLAAPPLLLITRLLFTGGKMSRLPARALLVTLACAAMLAGLLMLSYAVQRGLTRLATRADLRLRVTAAAVLCGLLPEKLNQWVLPGLYDYLHAALATFSFLSYMTAGWLWLELSDGRTSVASRIAHARFAWAPGLALSALALSATLTRLDQNQNVRVALLSPNVPHSRAVVQALGPLLIEPAQRRAIQQARMAARAARADRARQPRRGAGPVLEDAHILLITVDALRPDHLGAYGYARPASPQLDKFAAESVLFERAYAQAPHSSYSLSSLMTSEYLHETLDLGAPPPEQTLATTAAAAGYHTAGFFSQGIFHTAGERLGEYERNAFGFALHDQVTYTAEQLTDRVIQEVDRTAARGEPNALFWVHYFDVHEPYLSTHFGSSAMERYDSEILHVDAQIARLIREVRKRLKRTVIVAISADHGEEFYEHGGVYHGSALYEEQVRVPLLLNAPGFAPRRVTTPVKSLDLAPTLLSLVGLPPAPGMRGDDLRAIALGNAGGGGPVFSAVIHKKMVVRWPYKLIADLRFGLFELYDLEHDPHERENLADRRPELLDSLRAEVYAWLDSLTPRTGTAADDVATALDRGRVGDRRSVEPLCHLLEDAAAAAPLRMEAARILGRLDDERATPSLHRALRPGGDACVRAEAAIALGRMVDASARAELRMLVAAEDPQTRVRAAVSLGRLRDRHAVPGLIEALYIGQDDYERQEAVRWLGRLRDPRAVEPLLEVLPEMRTRYLVPIAVGTIGDRRAYEALLEVLSDDTHANVRDAAAEGLGLLGDPRAIAPIVALAARDPSLTLATESLVRLGALQRGAIGGVDLVDSREIRDDFSDCYAGPLRHDWDYLHRTSCVTRSREARLSLPVPPAVAAAADGVAAVLGIKRVDQARAGSLVLSIGDREFDAIQVDGSFAEHRFALPAAALGSGQVVAHLRAGDPETRFSVDHLLLLPLDSAAAEHARQP